MAVSTEPRLNPPALAAPLTRGRDAFHQAAALVLLTQAALWAFLLFRWATFSRFNWTPYPAELVLADWSPLVAYGLYGLLLVWAAAAAVGLLRVGRDADSRLASRLALAYAAVTLLGALAYYALGRDFIGAVLVVAAGGLLLCLLTRNAAWSLAFPSAFWLLVFFLAPLAIVFVVSLGERTRLGTVTYPSLANLAAWFDDYARVFSRVGGDFIYLRIFARSAWLALLNTALCLLFGFPLAYWIARQPANRRNMWIFLVMIPFWTNFLVRTYAWMLILRDSGLINNVWTGSLHDVAVGLSGNSALFSRLAEATARPLPLLYNFGAVLIGLFYGYLPFMVLPLYSTLEKTNWTLLEAAADLGANGLRRFTRILLPLSLPGIIAGSIIVFIPSLGAYVTPDLMGGAKVSLLGNLLQQQFMTVRDWPFGSALSFIMMAVMLAATLVYFRASAEAERRQENGR
jgi:spermidine/putrescine transport system permease protein